MHWVDRGPEPDGLSPIRDHYTPRWVQHYRHKSGPRPSDARWREFLEDLKQPFAELCAYCEGSCKGEVDHFRPKSRFPGQVYDWANWLFACHDCNLAKGDKWPPDSYIDPCAKSTRARPGQYFAFNTQSGGVAPKPGLSQSRYGKAKQMINDLALNAGHHRKKRQDWLLLVCGAIPNDPNDETNDSKICRNWLESHNTPYSSITRAWLAERGYPIND